MSKILLSVDEARATLGGIGRTKLYALVNDPKTPLRIVKVGSRSMLRACDVEAYAASLSKEAAA